jgi:hypothetical protein
MEEAGDEPLFCERAAGIDIGKQLVAVTIRVPSEARRGGRQQETREFRHDAQGTARAGGLAALLGREQGRDGIDQRLLEAGVLPAGAGGA